MIRFIPVLSLSLLIVMQAHARNVAIIGAGNVSCGRWTEVRNQVVRHVQLRQWVLGFISGINWNTEGSQAVPQDQEAVVAFIDQYCKNNPLHALLYAAVAVAQETGGPKVNPLHQWKR
jgi:hypothetical protein